MNNFPISVSQIAEGMNNAGSMLAVANNSLDQSIALLTAANTTVQDISKASTGLRTIAARIRKTVTEEDGGEAINEAKYEEMLGILTKHQVTLTEINGEYRSTYDVIKDIAGVWEQLTSMEQAAVTEALAGTRQQNVFSSLVTQFREAEGAMERMDDSSGELQEAYDIYLDSIEAHVKTLKAAYNELAMDFVNSDLAKRGIDILTGIIELLDRIVSSVGGLNTILASGAILVLIKLLTGNAFASAVLSISKFFIETLPAIIAMGPALAAVGVAIASIVAIAGEIKKLNTEGYIGEGHELKEYQENVESLEAEVARLQKEYDNLAECGADLTMVENELAHAQNALRNATEEQTKALADQAEQADRTRSALVHLQNGGNVDLLNRPVISSQKLKNAGWGDVGAGGATVFTNTYSNEDNTAAMNFTPILVDANGNYVGVMSPEELEDYAMGVINGVHDDYLNLKIGATYFGGHAIEHAEEDAQRIHELHEEYYKDELKYISDFEDSLNDLSGKTLDKLMRGEKLTREETEELALWLQKSGRSAEESSKLFEDYAKDIRDAAEAQDKLKADKALGDLTSLQDELSETTKALEEYKEAMKGGEKGDAVKEMADIYKGALEDLKSGRVDSRRVHNAAELFFSQEQLAAMNYDMAEIGKALQSSLLQSLFNPEGDSEQSYGQRFAKYIEENAAKFAKAGAAVEKTADGYRFHYDSLQKLADAFGISREACSAFLDDLDAYGIEVMRSTEENTELARQFLEVQQGVNSARDAVVEFIKRLYDAGRDSMEIQSILNDLARDGVINLNPDEINEVLADTMTGLKEIDKESVEPSVELQTASAYADANTLHNYLLRLFSQTITQTVHLDYQGEVSTRQGAGYANYTGQKGNGGSARAQGGVTGKVGPTLVNELGPELISDKGKAFIANHGEPGFVNLSDEAIVFTADETKEIAKKGGLVSGGSAYADGTRKGLIGRLLSDGDVPARASGWTCPFCGRSNPSTVSKCRGCGKDPRTYKPTAVTSTAQQANQQAKVNSTSTTTTTTSTSSNSNRWRCNHCGFANPQTAVKCQSCGAVRGTVPTNTPTTKTPEQTIQLAGGTYWKCSNCGRQNSTSVNYCASCGKYRFSTNVTTIPGNPSTGWQAQQSLNYDDLFSFGSDGGSGGGGGVGGADSQSKSNPQKIDWIAVKLNRIQREISDLETVASSGLKKLSTRLDAAKNEASKLNEEIGIAQSGYNRYIQEANSVGLRSDLAEKVRNGTIDINEYDDEELRQQIQEYQEWYEKALQCASAVEELNQQIGELYKTNFDLVQQDYANQLGLIEHEMNMINADMSMAQAKGMLDSASFYERLAERESASIGKMKNELSDLERYFKEAMDSGKIQEGSEEWYAMKQSILGVKEAIAQANVQMQEYSNTIREINWSYFDTAQERFSQMTQEANFLISLMQNKKLFDDKGQFSGAGIGTLGMHMVNYDSYMSQAEAYGREFEKVANEWSRDRNNQDLLKRRNELWQLQRESILAAEQEKDAVRSLVEEGIRIELDALRELIDTYKERLDVEKEAYEYSKKISEKSKNIASLQKQMSAYENDKSEETRARMQKLTQELEKARTDLQETERDKSISEQKKILDDVYNQYEELMNGRLDDVDRLMREMIDVANARSGEIRSAIMDAAASVGYTISGGGPGTAGMTTAMDSYAFFDRMFEGTAATQAILSRISDNVIAMARAAGAVKAYAKGGIIDYTGLAAVHGSPGNPEMVLSAADTEKFLQAAQMMQVMNGIAPSMTRDIRALIESGGGNGMNIGGITLDISIDHVQDYNDFVTQLQADPKFEKLIDTMTMGRMLGGSKLAKNGIRF